MWPPEARDDPLQRRRELASAAAFRSRLLQLLLAACQLTLAVPAAPGDQWDGLSEEVAALYASDAKLSIALTWRAGKAAQRQFESIKGMTNVPLPNYDKFTRPILDPQLFAARTRELGVVHSYLHGQVREYPPTS
jgi:hypothetical protein